MMENLNDGIQCYLAEIPERPEMSGAIVMNANPFTLGHLYLAEYAAARCHILHVFVVEEDRSIFPFPIRLELVRPRIGAFA